jgi:hypothetical protein
MIRQIAATLLMFMAGIRASTAETKAEFKDVHSICIISRLGDTLKLSRFGATIFGNANQEVPIGDWNLNDSAAQIIATELSAKFTIAPVKASGMLGCTNQNISPDSDVDAYVILIPASEPNPAKPLLQVTGIGIFSQYVLIGSDLDYIHALTQVAVIDAHTGKRIDYGTAGITKGVILGDSVPPWLHLDASEWPDPPNPPSPNLLAKAHDKILDLLQQSVPYALQKAGLY